MAKKLVKHMVEKSKQFNNMHLQSPNFLLRGNHCYEGPGNVISWRHSTYKASSF